MNPSWPLTIYYDASCPLCRQEMHAIVDCDTHGRLRLRDVSGLAPIDEACTGAALGRDDLMRLIHARDAGGRWYRGIEVFELAYAAAGLHGLARLWGHPRLRGLWERLYPWIAAHRQGLSRLRLDRPFGWLVRLAARRAQRRARACSDGACDIPGSAASGRPGAHPPSAR